MTTNPLQILLLYDDLKSVAATVHQHVAALSRQSRHRVWSLGMLGSIPAGLDLNRFDVIVIHYSLTIASSEHIDAETIARIAASPALKVIFIQDEYRHVDATVRAMQALDVDVLFTCVPAAEIEKVYPKQKLPKTLKLNTMTGFVDQSLLGLPRRPLAERPIDVAYRARKPPAWLGELGQEKWRIGQRFQADAKPLGLKCDISHREEDRIYGPAWIKFLSDAKATLGVESGSSVFDFTGEIQRQVDAAVLACPDMPFEALQKRFFAAEEGRVRLNQISPRCFEAAALGTLMILYPGEYSGRLIPWRHYVPLEKDHSNMAEVVAVLRDPVRAQEIVDAAYEEVASAPENSFARFAEMVDDVLSTTAAARSDGRTVQPYGEADFARAAVLDRASRSRLLRRQIKQVVYNFLFGNLLGWLQPTQRDRAHHFIRRFLLVRRKHQT